MSFRPAPALALASLAATAALAPGRASACGGVEPPEYTLTAISPAEGTTGVPRDTGILVTAQSAFEGSLESVDVTVTLTDVETGSVIAGRSVGWFSEAATAAWSPDEPLLPGRSYQVEVVPADYRGTPIEGATPIRSSFVTSSALLEPLTFSGDIQVSVEVYDEVVRECDVHPCTSVESNCVDVGTRRDLRARLELPAAVGGQTDAGQYRATFYFNDEKPYNLEDRAANDELRFGVQGLVQPTAGQTVLRDQYLFREDFDYAPCFTYVVWDLAGHQIQTSRCLPVLTQAEYAAATADDAPAPEQSPSTALDDAVTASDDALPSGAERNPIETQSAGVGCAFGSSPTTPGGVLVAVAALLGGLARRRSRAPAGR